MRYIVKLESVGSVRCVHTVDVPNVECSSGAEKEALKKFPGTRVIDICRHEDWELSLQRMSAKERVLQR